jgi:YVTN family beta-propeller protein
VTVGIRPVGVAVNPNTNMIYVDNYDSNTTSVIDGKTNMVVANIISLRPWAVAVNSNMNMIYLANFHSNILSVVSGKLR